MQHQDFFFLQTFPTRRIRSVTGPLCSHCGEGKKRSYLCQYCHIWQVRLNKTKKGCMTLGILFFVCLCVRKKGEMVALLWKKKPLWSNQTVTSCQWCQPCLYCVFKAIFVKLKKTKQKLWRPEWLKTIDHKECFAIQKEYLKSLRWNLNTTGSDRRDVKHSSIFFRSLSSNDHALDADKLTSLYDMLISRQKCCFSILAIFEFYADAKGKSPPPPHTHTHRTDNQNESLVVYVKIVCSSSTHKGKPLT